MFGIKLYMFRTVPLFIIRSFSLYTQQWYISYRFADSLRAGSGWFVFPVIMYGREMWSRTLSDEHRLGAFKNRVLRRIIVPKRDED